MLVVKIELWPGGDESKAEEIGRTYITNVGGTTERGDYKAAVCRRGSTKIPREMYPDRVGVRGLMFRAPKAARTGGVTNYPRLSYNVWRLVCRALRACFPEERDARS